MGGRGTFHGIDAGILEQGTPPAAVPPFTAGLVAAPPALVTTYDDCVLLRDEIMLPGITVMPVPYTVNIFPLHVHVCGAHPLQ